MNWLMIVLIIYLTGCIITYIILRKPLLIERRKKIRLIVLTLCWPFIILGLILLGNYIYYKETGKTLSGDPKAWHGDPKN